MKKVLSVLLAVAMLLSVSAVSTIAFAETVGSIETTTKGNKITVEVNGNTSGDVSYEKDPDDPTKITFTYEGDGELEGWEFPGMTEGVDYQIISEDGDSITIQLINGYNGEVIANAIVKGEETTKGKKKNDSNKSPGTGVTSAAGLAVAGAGAAILIASRKKDDAE